MSVISFFDYELNFKYNLIMSNESKILFKFKENEKMALSELKEMLYKKFEVVDLRIFGSRVKGGGNFESDIDVMIELAESNPEIESQIDDIIFEINLKYESFISAVIFNKKEIEEGPLSESPIYKIIQKEGLQF